MSNLNKDSVDKANASIEALLRTETDQIGQRVVKIVSSNDSPLTVQFSKRGPSYSKVLDSNRKEITHITAISVSMDADHGWPELMVKVLNPRIEVID